MPLSLLAIGTTAIASVAPIALLASLDGSDPGDGAKILLATIACSFLWTAVLVFFSVALAQAASGGFDGRPLTMREALAEARMTLGAIALWALIALFVGTSIQLLGATGEGGRLASPVLGLCWAFLVTFVVPIIALAGADAREAIAESAALARRRWGEQLSGGVAIFALTLLVAFGWGVIFGFGLASTKDDHDAIGAVALVVGATGLAFTVVLSFATAQAFVVALFRFDGGELSLEELESPPPAPPIGRSSVFRVAGIIAGLLVMATLTGALLPHRHHSDSDLGFYTPENGWYYASFKPGARVPLGAGAPVIFEKRKVGVVIESRLEPERVVVWFRADPALEDPIEANPKTIGEFNGSHYLQVGPRAGPESSVGAA